VDTTGEDHIYDELRYVCMERPVKAQRKPTAVIRAEYDPLDIGMGGYQTRVLFG
jgi:hypothetical protein